MKYESKTELMRDIKDEREALMALLETFSEARRTEPGVWGDGWTVSDLVAHLAAWHRLFLGWFEGGRVGRDPELPAPGYKWNETPRLNQAIWSENRGRSYSSVLDDFETSFGEVHSVLRGLSETELLEPGHFGWTGRNGLVTYAGANTASHYRFAIKVLKRWEGRERVTSVVRVRSGAPGGVEQNTRDGSTGPPAE